MIQSTMQRVPLSLNNLLERAGKLYPQSGIVSRPPDKSLVRHRFADFYRRSRALASALVAAGLKKGDRVANPQARQPRDARGAALASRFQVCEVAAARPIRVPRLYPAHLDGQVLEGEAPRAVQVADSGRCRQVPALVAQTVASGRRPERRDRAGNHVPDGRLAGVPECRMARTATPAESIPRSAVSRSGYSQSESTSRSAVGVSAASFTSAASAPSCDSANGPGAPGGGGGSREASP
jgi:hypothetical protein